MFGECIKSDNYLMGCDVTLSEKLCVKQIGTVLGDLAQCIFDESCHVIQNMDSVQCSDKITHSGCLQITSQHCKWENHKCQELNNQDYDTLQTTFMDKELSISVCPLITGYLIMHHSVLWPLVDYQPDMIEESDNLILEDEGQYIEETPTYSTTDALQNNYIDTTGKFVWYEYKVSKVSTASNLKINDQTRYGCIAIEVLSDSDYLTTFSLRGTIFGVNHVYCKYLTKHPTDPQLSIFHESKCMTVTEEQLRDNNFIGSNNITCQQMSGYLCQRLRVDNLKCMIHGETEYDCISFDESLYQPNTDCLQRSSTATYYQCLENEFCFLNIQSAIGFCDSSCYQLRFDQSACNNNAQCYWSGEASTVSPDSILLHCLPYNGCSTYGLSEQYCIRMALQCFWNAEKSRCEDSINVALISCEDANTLFTCTTITRQDQYCIWYNDACINLKKQPLLSYFKSLPQNIMMNRITCVSMESEYYYYVPSTKLCLQTKQITMKCLDKTLDSYKEDLLKSDLPCTNVDAQHITKFFCLNFLSSYTRWDQYNYKCLNLAEEQLKKPCDTFKLVNPRVCSQTVYAETEYCFYDEKRQNCYTKPKEGHTLKCQDRGLDKSLCTKITTQGQFCQWSYGKCRTLIYRQILPYKCNSLLNVNGNSCAYFTSPGSCLYDPDYASCAVGYGPESTCNVNLNPDGCEQSSASCYYDYVKYKCLDTTPDILSIINCEGSKLSQNACKQVTKAGQACVWDSACKFYPKQYTVTCTTFTTANTQVCKYLQSEFVNYFLDGTYCELINNVCTATREAIVGCGSDRDINVHRCVAYTNSNCYFDSNFKCIEVKDEPYKNVLLNTLNCTQTNLNLCGKITTKGQTCWVVDNNSNLKCSYYSASKTYTCSEMGSLNTSGAIKVESGKKQWFNRNMCYLATDSCHFDITQSKCLQDLNLKLKCDHPGLSKVFCLTQSVGGCYFNNRTCDYLDFNDLSIACELRNRQGCLMGGQKCQWSNNKCSVVYDPDLSCPTIYDVQFSWMNCGTSQNIQCWAYVDQCTNQDIVDLPCEAGLSQGTCQSLDHYCVWSNSRCQGYNPKIHSCQNAVSLYDCVQNYNKDEYCAYVDKICFNVNPQENTCDQFNQVSLAYCQEFPNCIYDTVNSKCINVRVSEFYESKQLDSRNNQGVSCSDLDKMHCLFQKSANCQISYNSCGDIYWSNFETCPNYEFYDQYDGLLSDYACKQFSDCEFFGSKDGQVGLCYKKDEPITCSQLNQSFCVVEFATLECMWNLDDNVCQDVPEDINCDSIFKMNVSNSSCRKANLNSADKSCYFNSNESLCKPMYIKTNLSCQDVEINYADDQISKHVHCAFTNSNCYIIHIAEDFKCQSTADQTNVSVKNIKLCISQVDNTYMFNLQKYTCDVITTDTELLNCHFLNQNACIKLTNKYSSFKCVWDDSECRDIVKSDYDTIECKYRNLNTCFMSNTIQCIYKDDLCQNYAHVDSICTYSETTLVSPMVCQSNGCLSDGKHCFSITVEPDSYYRCKFMGLTQDQCINKTSYTKCYWNADLEYCDDANLSTLKCDDVVSQQTCTSIKTPGQYCKWTDLGCVNLEIELDCREYDNQFNGCIQQETKSCYYDFRYNQCRDAAQVYEACYEGLSKKACKEIANEVCVMDQGQCSRMTSTFYTCRAIYNKFGCYYIDLSCIWDDELGCQPFTDKLPCNELPKGSNRYTCKYNAVPISGVEDCEQCNCSFDDATLSCTYRLSGLSVQNFEQVDQSNYNQIRLTQLCVDMKDYHDCIGNLIDSCKWVNGLCINSDFKGCESQSIKACLAIENELCSWRDYSCYPWNKNKFEIALVTKNVCKQLDQSLNAKYDENTQSCIPTKFEVDDCNIVSVSKITCLSIRNHPCIYQDELCKFYSSNQQLPKCTNYQNINYLICQSLSHIACKFNAEAFQCVNIDSKTDGCSTVGLSQKGCASIQTEACYWDGFSCQKFQPINNINQCDSKTIMNSLACSQVAYLDRPCSFDSLKQVCTSKFNRQSKCDTPGLNKSACLQLENEACQYVNNRCQKFVNGNYKCYQLTQVNSKVCQILETDTCAYDITTNSCYSILNFLSCSSLGVNVNSCSILSNCSWNNDDKKCQCNQIEVKDVCYSKNKDTCIQNSSNCHYSAGQCYKKKCSDLQIGECQGIVNKETCYINQDYQCQGATQCEDIVYLSQSQNCNQFNFNGSVCITINNYCISATNLDELCINSDCSINSCILDQGICRPLSCQDFSEDDCFQNEGCAMIDGLCVEVESCNQISDPAICRMVIVDNKQCSWEEYRILDESKICTNSQCELYGPAYTICNGNEINGKTCVLVDLIKCKMCEEITDVCICNNSNNACTFVNGKCQSISCASFDNEQLCSDSKRCYWSQQDKVCRKMCVQNIRQDQCEALIYECHWNPYMKLCEQGVEIIPDISIDIDIDEQFGQLILLNLIIILSI
ncbi:unnamed protein product (macronuclear) [Paramecium tetraurelia]|uniref:PSI domain-containing protein n=1 Tax=Paramecium tetraurelia TaxID=5888 RepID=A0DDG8_PARTE|nr:uncharacterized protein GSPATT00015944001 [Paramecium tetraurelia]CAK81085.1 unnamed protein product [Paramecium tetraurelia]|eukprot:XP_001448482.1 hypothetical protein (macronuclear) [Paramecium tetraurelia strain d4-2]